MAKCSICGKKVQITFLKKILGTYVKDEKGKRKIVCFECQRRYHNKNMLI